MIADTGDRLATIQQKIQTIQDRLEANRLCPDEDDEAGCCGVSTQAWRSYLSRQVFYAHCAKVVALCVVALAHLVYMQPFLTSYSALEDYNQRILQMYPHHLVTAHGIGTREIQHLIEYLYDYRKNMWLTVGAMCIALSTTCFFLFMAPITVVRRLVLNFMRVIDFVAYLSISLFLAARIEVADRVSSDLQRALEVSHRITSADRLMNTLFCSIHYRDRLPFCSTIIVDSIFPVTLLKYLLILVVLTAAYIALAYLIEYCIRHWFPPTHPLKCLSTCIHDKRHYIPVCLPPKNPLVLDA